MEFYFQIELSRKVPTRMNEAGMDTAVCRAETEEDAIAQLLPEMRGCVKSIKKRRYIQSCYPHPEEILKD